MDNKRRNVIVVCMVDSIHSARWLRMFVEESISFTLIPSTPNRRIHPIISELIKNSNIQRSKYKLNPLLRWLAIPLWGADLLFGNRIRGRIVARFAKKLDADFIHAMELNHGGYITSVAHKVGLPSKTKIISSNWGSDIFWFQKFKRHQERISELMRVSNYYSAECQRDLQLAINFGFTGKFFEVFPTAGGFEYKILQNQFSQTSSRSTLLVKGYESFVGRASIALEALSKLNFESLKDLEVVIYSANNKTKKLAKTISKKIGIEIVTHSKKSLTHSQMLDLFKLSRVYLGVSLSDGISTSLLEAMVTGAFPIQTDTSCASEWITDGHTGFIVEPTVESVVKALNVALTNDHLVDSASEKNFEVAKQKLDNRQIREKAIRFYSVA